KSDNPYQAQLDRHLQAFGITVLPGNCGTVFLHTALTVWKPDVLHLHWLHFFLIKSNRWLSLLSGLLFVGQLAVLRLLGVKLVWTVHNLKNHANQHLTIDRFFTALVARLAHRIIAHGEIAKQEIVSTFHLRDPQKVAVIPHGNYKPCYENRVSRETARQRLGLAEDKLVFLFLGLIRPYKGVLELIDAFIQLNNPKTQLVIAGKVWDDGTDQTAQLQQQVATHSNILFHPGFVPNDQIQVYMNACDVAVFPYRDSLTSGAVLLALSFGRACLAPRIGCIAEVLDDMGSFLYNPGDVTALSQTLHRVIEQQPQITAMGHHNLSLADRYDWHTIAEKTADVYRTSLQLNYIDSSQRQSNLPQQLSEKQVSHIEFPKPSHFS
ncbi:MAG TPA: glycosyltransferase, partial [Allocoleopsis sp.]